MADIIDLDARRAQDDGCDLAMRERKIRVLGSDYTVRTMRGSTGRGWFSVRDQNDRMLFVRMLGFPEQLIGDLVLAWLDGRTVGRQDHVVGLRRQSTGGEIA